MTQPHSFEEWWRLQMIGQDKRLARDAWDAAVASQQAERSKWNAALTKASDREYLLTAQLADAKAVIERLNENIAAQMSRYERLTGQLGDAGERLQSVINQDLEKLARYERVIRQIAESAVGCGSIEHTYAIDAARELFRLESKTST